MSNMTSLQRVLTSLQNKEPDRVPFFLFLTLHGARELGLSIQEYFSKPENVTEGQLRMLKKYRHDCLYPFYYAALEIEAWKGETIFFEDGPPNAGEPILSKIGQIKHLIPPVLSESHSLLKVLQTIQTLKDRFRNEVPIIGVVMSPFSLPVMQLGFDKYLDLIYFHPTEYEQLIRVNEAFCIEWANAQLQAGATAICYYDPVSSPTIVPREIYLKTGYVSAKRTLSQIKGPTATHLASGRAFPILEDIIQTGTQIIGVSNQDDLTLVKQAVQDRISIIGNLNGLEMRNWSAQETEKTVKEALLKGGPGGGYILADHHGEIPFYVPEDVLLSISETVHKWGVYPLNSLQ